MKKILIAIFLAVIMLMIPISTAVKTAEISKNVNISPSNEVEPPQFYITKDDYDGINAYIEISYQDEEKQEAYDIRDRVINPEDLEVYIIELAEAFIEYSGIRPIPDNLLTIENIKTIEELNDLLAEYWNVVDGTLLEGIFKELLDKLIELIKDRLGWIIELVERSYELFENSVNLVYNYIQPAAVAIAVLVVKVINQILSVPDLFRQLITDLFNLEFELFIGDLLKFIDDFGTNVSDLIQTAKDIVNDQQLKDYFDLFQSYIDWLTSKPWEASILITGVVRRNLGFLEGGTVTCRGESAITDSNGFYSFSVRPNNTANDSFPPFQWYGLHKCTITVSKDGEVLKQSMPRLSYSFSGGKIDWRFLIITPKSKDKTIRAPIIERIFQIFEKIFNLFPNIFSNINRICG